MYPNVAERHDDGNTNDPTPDVASEEFLHQRYRWMWIRERVTSLLPAGMPPAVLSARSARCR
jgi:hypothetical protein